MSNISNSFDKIEVGSLVKHPKFPNKTYIVEQTDVTFCGNNNCVKLKSTNSTNKLIVEVNSLILVYK